MAEDLEITGATTGDISYVVAYYDVTTNNLYNANGQLYGNSTFSTTLGNEFILELHYVQDISTSENPEEWAVWDGLKDMTVSSTVAFDDNYVHAVEGSVAQDTVAGSPTVRIHVPEISKDVLSSSGNLVFNPFGIEPENAQPNETRPVKQIVSYNAFNFISDDIFEFTIEDAQGLPLNVVGGDNPTPVRVSDPLYLFVGTDAIYENNIPDRYEQGVFKIPMNINSRKLLRALDYSGASGVSGTMEHNIYVERNMLSGIVVSGSTFSRNSDGDKVAKDLSDSNTYVFCDWTSGSTSYWTRGKDVVAGTPLYTVSGGTATLTGSTTSPVYDTDSVLFRTFAFPFIVKNLVDYGNTITIPVENTDWTKDYIISIIRNNMEIVIGKASTASYGTVMVSNDGTIDVNDGVISIATSLATKQDNMSATAPVAINNSTVSLNFGDGLAVGVAGSTNANKLIVNEASVKEVLEDVVDGGTEPAVNEIVTADNLRGALSVGQAVDVSCAPRQVTWSQISTDDGANWSDYSDELMQAAYLDNFLLKTTAPSSGSILCGFGSTTKFPKFADNLKYLFILDVCNMGAAIYSYGCETAEKVYVNNVSKAAGGTTYGRYAFTSISAVTQFKVYAAASGSNMQIGIKNWRQYEVTALTDEAIAYIAQLPDPDAFFRSTDAYSIRDKYLIKQDMVAPWIPTIPMPDNRDLTVAAGLSYRITYTDNNTHNVTVDTIPTNAYGWDSHIQMFVKGASNVKFKEPLILMDALTSNAGHNLIVKYRNGQALVYVDDLNAGNIVLSTTGSTVGTLNYYLQQNPGTGYENYIIFGAVTDGAVCDASSVSVAYNTNVIGNGTDNTTITGTYNVASGKTMNLQDLVVSGSTINGAGNIVVNNVTIVNDMDVASGSKITFGDSNVLNSTLSGAGQIVFSDGSVVTSTDGSGVIKSKMKSSTTNYYYITDKVTLSNILITGITTGNLSGAIGTAGNGDLTLTGCTVTGNIGGNAGGLFAVSSMSKLTIKNCLLGVNGSGEMGTSLFMASYSFAGTSKMNTQLYAEDSIIGNNVSPNSGGVRLCGECYLKNCWLSAIYINARDAINTPTEITIEGGTFASYMTGSANIIKVVAGSTIYFTNTEKITGLYGTPISIGYMNESNMWTVGNSAKFIFINGITTSLSGCVFNNLSTDGTISGLPNITCGSMDAWSAENAIFASPLDATEANTIKLSGTKFTTTAKTLNASRIQLPASTTVSFQGNTNSDNTKILDASLIVVGDNPASPSGSATIVNASGSSITVSGIGTYIDKEGDNDFIALNKVVSVDTDSAFTTALTATTGSDGTNRFIKLATGSTVTASYEGDTQVINKNIITSDYEPILGGTFTAKTYITTENSVDVTYTPSLSVINDSNKVVINTGSIQLGNVNGSKNTIIDLNGHNIVQRAPFNVRNITFTNGDTPAYKSYVQSGGVMLFTESNTSGSFTNCVFCNNHANRLAGAISVDKSNAIVTISGCTFYNNSNDFGVHTALFHITNGGVLNIDSCDIDDSYMSNYGYGSLNFSGNTKLLGYQYQMDTTDDTHNGYVSFQDNLVLDLRGNTHSTVFANYNGIPIGSSVSIIYDNGGTATEKTAVISGATVGSISNDGTLLLTGISNNEPSYYMETITLDKNWSISNATLIKHPNTSSVETRLTSYKMTLNSVTFLASDGYFNVGSEIEATDCTFSGAFILSGTRKTITNCTINGQTLLRNDAPVVLSGTIKFGTYGSMSYNQNSNSEVTLENGCILDATSATPSQVLLNPAATQTGKIKVVEGGTATLKYKSGSSTLTKTLSGSYTTIYADGTVVS